MRVISILRSDHQYDVTDAEKWGPITYLLSGQRVNPFNTDNYVDAIIAALDGLGYDAEDDVLMLTGSPIATALLLSTALTCKSNANGSVKVLLFDNRTNVYVQRRLTAADRRQAKVKG